MPESTPRVLVFRDSFLLPSETFLLNSYSSFETFETHFLTMRRHEHPALERLSLTAFDEPLSRILYRDIRYTRGLAYRLSGVRPGAIHAHFARDGALMLPLARRLDVPLFVHFHGADATRHRDWARRFPRSGVLFRRKGELIRHGAGFICVSGALRDRILARGFPAERTITLHTGIQIEGGAGDWPPPAEREGILFVGRLVEKKGLDDLFEIARRVQIEAPWASLTVVGDGPERPHWQAAAASLPGPVTFTGWLTRKDVLARMRRARVLLVPSKHARDGDAEGLPNTVMEAASMGLPVVSTRHSGIPEFVLHEETGLLAGEGDRKALLDHCRRLLTRDEEHARYQAAADRRVRSHFDAREKSRELERLFLDAVRSRFPRLQERMIG